jgi:hypothetical protein
MELEKIIEDGPPEEATDLLADVDYPPWDQSGRTAFIYITRKKGVVAQKPRDQFIVPTKEWTVIFSKKPFGAEACEKLQLRPANRRTVASMMLAWAAGSKSLEVKTKKGNWAGALTEDPSIPGQYRFTRFDAEGPWGHSEGKDPLVLLQDAWSDGYRVLCRGCVDQVLVGR